VGVDVGMGGLLCMGRCKDGSFTVLVWECYCVWVDVRTGVLCVWVDVGMGVLLCMGRCWDGSATVYVHVRVELVFYVDIAVQD
jgi:hypothetical protein